MKPTPTVPGPRTRFVAELPDLITPEDYQDAPGVKKMRIRITVSEAGVEILGDSMYAPELDALLARLGVAEIERMLCG